MTFILSFAVSHPEYIDSIPFSRNIWNKYTECIFGITSHMVE